MRLKLFKIVIFFAVLFFIQGIILPWIISSDTIPLWLGIILLSFGAIFFLMVLENLSYFITKVYRGES